MALSRRIIKVIGIFSGVQAVGIACAIVRAKFIALWIGTAGVGLFAVFNNVLSLLSTATQLNIRQSAVRDISSSPSGQIPGTAGVVRWWSRRLGVCGAAIMLMLSPVLSYASFGDFSWWWAFGLLSLAVFAMALTSGEQAIMQGTGKLGQLARSTLAAAVTATALSVPMYYLYGEDSIIPSILVFAISAAFFTMMAQDTPSASNSKAYNIAKGRDFIRLGAYLTVSSVAATAASYVFISILNRISTDIAGIYQAGYTLVIQYTGIIFTALAMEYFPRISQVCMRPRMTSVVLSHEIMVILYILTPLLVLFISADELALRILYSDDFLAALPFVTIGIGAMVFRAVSYCMAYVIIGRGDGKTYIATELISTVVGLTLNISMFHFYGFAGLGISYVLWYAIYTVIVGIVCRRYGVCLSRDAIILTAVSTAVVAAAICLKQISWAAVLPMLLPAALLALRGYRLLMRR